MPEILSEAKLQDRRRCLEEHIQAENSHDVNAIMKTFAPDGMLVFNGLPLGDHDKIRALHEELGFGEQGGFSDLQIEEKQRYVSQEAIILEQVVSGTHEATEVEQLARLGIARGGAEPREVARQ